MFFQPLGCSSLCPGRLAVAEGCARPIVKDDQGIPWPPERVAYVIPDDEPMEETARKSGYKVHTVMSTHLGLDSLAFE